MNPDNLAKKVFDEFQTYNVSKIAEKADIKIIYQKWFPVTSGEFNWKTKTICVNKNAEAGKETIIAHELGHYFLREFLPQRCNDADFDQEKFCDDFAKEILMHQGKFILEEVQRKP